MPARPIGEAPPPRPHLPSVNALCAPLAPYGAALLDEFEGRRRESLYLRSSLGEEDDLPVEVFFRGEDGLFPFEPPALESCAGRILDVGAGTGVHSLFLQEWGLDVTAVEIVPEAAEILRRRGVRQVLEGDLFELDLARFDTVLMLMNGIGPVGTLSSLERFLARVAGLLEPGGQLLVDSGAASPAAHVDPAAWPPPTPEAYPGEAWIQLSYGALVGRPFRELYLDPDTLRRKAEDAGWRFGLLFEEEGGYLARLVPGESQSR